MVRCYITHLVSSRFCPHYDFKIYPYCWVYMWFIVSGCYPVLCAPHDGKQRNNEQPCVWSTMGLCRTVLPKVLFSLCNLDNFYIFFESGMISILFSRVISLTVLSPMHPMQTPIMVSYCLVISCLSPSTDVKPHESRDCVCLTCCTSST